MLVAAHKPIEWLYAAVNSWRNSDRTIGEPPHVTFAILR
jgi:hypothetical protein